MQNNFYRKLILYQTTKLKTGRNWYKINVTEKLKFVLGKMENIVGKGENAGNQHFLLFPHNGFETPLFQGR